MISEPWRRLNLAQEPLQPYLEAELFPPMLSRRAPAQKWSCSRNPEHLPEGDWGELHRINVQEMQKSPTEHPFQGHSDILWAQLAKSQQKFSAKVGFYCSFLLLPGTGVGINSLVLECLAVRNDEVLSRWCAKSLLYSRKFSGKCHKVRWTPNFMSPFVSSFQPQIWSMNLVFSSIWI